MTKTRCYPSLFTWSEVISVTAIPRNWPKRSAAALNAACSESLKGESNSVGAIVTVFFDGAFPCTHDPPVDYDRPHCRPDKSGMRIWDRAPHCDPFLPGQRAIRSKCFWKPAWNMPVKSSGQSWELWNKLRRGLFCGAPPVRSNGWRMFWWASIFRFTFSGGRHCLNAFARSRRAPLKFWQNRISVSHLPDSFYTTTSPNVHRSEEYDSAYLKNI